MNSHESVPLLVHYHDCDEKASDNALPIEQLLKKVDWHYEKFVGKDVLDQEYVQYSGETYTLACEDECIIEKYPMKIIVDAQSVQVITKFPKEIAEAAWQRVEEFVIRTNPRLRFVHLELDVASRELYASVLFPYTAVKANIYEALTYLCRVGTLILDEYARDILALLAQDKV